MSTELTTLESLDMDEVQQSVQKHELALEQMKADYLPLLDTPITDKKQLEVVKAARMNFKNTRLEGVQRLDAGCKALYANWKLWVKARDTFEKKFSDEEEKFRAKEKEFEEAQEREFLRIAQEEQRRVAARKERMFQIGFKFDGSKYILEGFAELTENEVSGLGVDDLQLGEWLNDLERQVAEHMERELEAARTAKIAAEALAAQQKAESERIAAAQAELERKQKEMEEKGRQMAERELRTRLDTLRGCGGVEYPDGNMGFGSNTKSKGEVLAMSIDEYDAWLSIIRDEVKAWQKEEEERRIKMEQERLAREEAMKAEAAQKAVEAERLRQEEEVVRAAQMEVERIASMGDKGKMEELSATLASIYLPDLHSAMGQHGIARVRKHLVDLINMVNSIAKDL